ncbi:MAG: DUF1403 family protein [Alphaproteobacteria bacterium]|nr:DUF1403 family protein [Alphaproteobacteria bacterium]
MPIDSPDAVADAAFAAGAGLVLLDQIFRSGQSGVTDGAEPAFAGALRQRLALRATAAWAALLRLREDEGGLRDAEHLVSFDAAPTPGGRLHRLWRPFATCRTRLNVRVVRIAADHLDLPPDMDCDALIAVAQESTGEHPLAAAARER